MYSWPECFAKRGCNEVISCLHHYIQRKVPRSVTHLDLFCDGYRGQNHNNAMIRYLFTLVFTGELKQINLYLPIRGHSFLPCDRVFGVIERMKRKKDTVQKYHEWEDMIKKKYSSVAVTGDMIFDHKGSSEAFFKSSITSHGQKFQVNKYKQFSFSASHKYYVKVSSAMSGFVSYSFALLKPNAIPRFPTTPVYDSLVSVKAKLDDVKSLY